RSLSRYGEHREDRNRAQPPYNPAVPSEFDTLETATCPITELSASATSDMASAPAARNELTMNCSLWPVCGAFRNAATVTASIAGASAGVSGLMSMCVISHPSRSCAAARCGWDDAACAAPWLL